jgi:hypothetical protein
MPYASGPLLQKVFIRTKQEGELEQIESFKKKLEGEILFAVLTLKQFEMTSKLINYPTS